MLVVVSVRICDGPLGQDVCVAAISMMMVITNTMIMIVFMATMVVVVMTVAARTSRIMTVMAIVMICVYRLSILLHSILAHIA